MLKKMGLGFNEGVGPRETLMLLRLLRTTSCTPHTRRLQEI